MNGTFSFLYNPETAYTKFSIDTLFLFSNLDYATSTRKASFPWCWKPCFLALTVFSSTTLLRLRKFLSPRIRLKKREDTVTNRYYALNILYLPFAYYTRASRPSNFLRTRKNSISHTEYSFEKNSQVVQRGGKKMRMQAEGCGKLFDDKVERFSLSAFHSPITSTAFSFYSFRLQRVSWKSRSTEDIMELSTEGLASEEETHLLY